MRTGVLPILAATFLSYSLTRAQASCQESWKAPSEPNLSSNLTVGDFYEISWYSNLTLFFPTYAKDADVSSVDLWITDYNLHIHSHLIAARQNLNAISSLTWRVNVSSEELLETNQWVFRWLPQGVTYTETSEQVSSPGFYVNDAAPPASSTSSSPATPTSITSSASSTPAISATTSSATVGGTSSPATAVGASSATNTPDSSSISHGLSTGAKAGIAIAAIFGVVFAVGAGWFLARKTGEKHGDNTGRAPPPSPLDRKEMKSSDSLQQQYMPTSVSTPQPAELEPDFSRSASTHELPGY